MSTLSSVRRSQLMCVSAIIWPPMIVEWFGENVTHHQASEIHRNALAYLLLWDKSIDRLKNYQLPVNRLFSSEISIPFTLSNVQRSSDVCSRSANMNMILHWDCQFVRQQYISWRTSSLKRGNSSSTTKLAKSL